MCMILKSQLLLVIACNLYYIKSRPLVLALSIFLNISIFMLGVSIHLIPGDHSIQNITESVKSEEFWYFIAVFLLMIFGFRIGTREDSWLLLNELLNNKKLKLEF